MALTMLMMGLLLLLTPSCIHAQSNVIPPGPTVTPTLPNTTTMTTTPAPLRCMSPSRCQAGNLSYTFMMDEVNKELKMCVYQDITGTICSECLSFIMEECHLGHCWKLAHATNATLINSMVGMLGGIVAVLLVIIGVFSVIHVLKHKKAHKYERQQNENMIKADDPAPVVPVRPKHTFPSQTQDSDGETNYIKETDIQVLRLAEFKNAKGFHGEVRASAGSDAF